MNIYQSVRNLAKLPRFQNLFIASKEIGIQLFTNKIDLSKLQEIYLNYLYMYDSIFKDIAYYNISKKIIDNEIYEDSYILWKRENKKEKIDNNKDLHLVPGNRINFPKR